MARPCFAPSSPQGERVQKLNELVALLRLAGRLKETDPAGAASIERTYRKQVQAFAEGNKGLAVKFAKRYKRRGVYQAELEQTATVGLLEAIRRWDPEKAVAFSTFATYWMRHEVQHYLRKKAPMVHIPANVHADQRKVKRASEEAGKPLTRAQLRRRTKLSGERVDVALETNTRRLGYAPLQKEWTLAGLHEHEDAVVEVLDEARSRGCSVEEIFSAVARPARAEATMRRALSKQVSGAALAAATM
jgi:RNA polymerase sigma factor (sigma-70 family)